MNKVDTELYNTTSKKLLRGLNQLSFPKLKIFCEDFVIVAELEALRHGVIYKFDKKWIEIEPLQAAQRIAFAAMVYHNNPDYQRQKQLDTINRLIKDTKL